MPCHTPALPHPHPHPDHPHPHPHPEHPHPEPCHNHPEHKHPEHKHPEHKHPEHPEHHPIHYCKCHHLKEECEKAAKICHPPPYNVDLYVRNVGRKHFRFLDVDHSNKNDGAHVLAYTLNNPHTANQHWRFQPKECFDYVGHIQCMQSGKFLSAEGKDHKGLVVAHSGTFIVMHTRPIEWQLIPLAKDVFAIKLIHEHKPLYLSCTPTDAHSDERVKLHEVDHLNKLTEFQKWTFTHNPEA